jgi:hypothetical protein
LCVVTAFALGACREPAPPISSKVSSNPPPPPAGGCAAPAGAQHLVVALTRFVVPHHTPPVREIAELTVDGTCTNNVECARVSTATLARVAGIVAAVGAVHPTEGTASPHYGARFLELRWDGGSCSLGDASQHPLADDDARRFGDAFSAVIDAVVATRPK